MGVPFYFAHLAERHRGVICRDGILGDEVLARDSGFENVHSLLVDYNNLVHNCAREAEAANRGAFASDAAMFDCVLSHVERVTLRLVEQVSPERLVCLAIDGVPPAAKIAQQRKRRFMAAAEARFKSSASRWRSSHVTPGTEFMGRLDETVRALRGRLEALRPGVRVVVSTSDEPGEGEHKLFALLRSQPLARRNAIVYGMDADLLMLGLLDPGDNVFVMRQEDARTTFVSIDELRRVVTSELRSSDPRQACLDYVLLCSLVGNDFLPHLSYLGVEDIPALLRAQSRLQRPLATYQPGDDGCHVRFPELRRLLEEVAELETQGMAAVVRQHRAARPPPGDGLDHRWTFLPLLNKEAPDLRPGEPGWRDRYLFHMLSSVHVGGACVELYVEGLEWNVRYYINHVAPEPAWTYPYERSPLASGVCARLEQRAALAAGWEGRHRLREPITAAHQLASVLPPRDADLLPPAHRAVMSDVSLGCRHMYPSRFRIRRAFRRRVWQCHPDIPALDLRAVQAALAQIRVREQGRRWPPGRA